MQQDRPPFALVVDDDALILLHATEILEEAGFSTLTATTAESALQTLDQHGDNIALVFTDVEMPGVLNGFALARQTAERWPSIGILVASAIQAPKEGDLPSGATFVEKPFSAKIIYDRLHEILTDDRKPALLKEKS